MSDYAPEVRLIDERRCPACGYTLDAVGAAAAPVTAEVQPGDEVVCMDCATILVCGLLGAWLVEPPEMHSVLALQVQADIREVKRRLPRGGSQ
jgi:hypothetical protein